MVFVIVVLLLRLLLLMDISMEPPVQPGSSENKSCIICKKNVDEEPGLKMYKSQTAVRNAAEKRCSLSRDKFATATKDILSSDSSIDLYYHSRCHSQYCAVKRKLQEVGDETPSTSNTGKSLRSKSDLPQSSPKGTLIPSCILCSTKQKRLKSGSGGGSHETLHKVQTLECSKTLLNHAKQNQGLMSSQRILALGSEDLVAIEVHYHNSCRLKFMKEASVGVSEANEKGVTSKRKQHEAAFAVFMSYIESEIIEKHVPKYVSQLTDLYKQQYKELWGADDQDIDHYLSQNFIRKVQSKFGEKLCVGKESNKGGNFLYPQGMSHDEAKLHLKNMHAQEDQIRCAALVLRAEILQMEKTKMPTPTSIQSLKENAPEIPPLTQLFYKTLLGGLAPNPSEPTQRKTLSMSSDAVFGASRGAVKPWKHTALGLGVSSMLGSKQAITILNRLGHAVSYDECKRLETEIAYTCSSGDLETPAGLMLQSALATGTAWDNYDLNIETPDGKNSLHVTVGIAYQNAIHQQTEDGDDAEQEQGGPGPSSSITGRPRRTYDGIEKPIPPFHTNLKLAKFKFVANDENMGSSDTGYVLLRLSSIEFMWLVFSRHEQLPLFNGFYSQFITDPLPLTVIAYMDPISQPPTRNDVVQETMLRSLKVADENKMPYHPVTYDLAVALKAYSIQSLRSPTFDRLIILLGHFHVELAFFGAVGTYISDSGLDYLLTEAEILAEGSLNGFIRGKHYNRCTRIHQVTAMALEKALFERFLKSACTEEHTEALETIQAIPKGDTKAQSEAANSQEFQKLLDDYEDFFQGTIKGELGETASYWAVYVYLINRLYRDFQRAVRTNNVERYIQVFPSLIDVFFALNRPNYARWGSYFLERLNHLDPAALDILKAGAFSTRRTLKPFSRSPIDLTLEQTVNRDAASSATGITHFANSESAFRRWCVSITQRSMAVSEMKDMSGIQRGETPANQLSRRRVYRDNKDVNKLLRKLDDTCNPFSEEAPNILVNIATGKAATRTTSTYLLGTLQRGTSLRHTFYKECVADDARLLKTVKRVKVESFAAANMKRPKPSREKKALGAAEGVRDAFGYLLSKTGIDLHHVLCFPITEVPLSIAHADGTPAKTEKAALTRLLESKIQSGFIPGSLVDATLFDGGLVFHEILPDHSASTYGKIATDIMIKVCSPRCHSTHLVLDRYIQPSIKDLERMNRGEVLDESNTFFITGADQQQKRKGTDLVHNGSFKEAFSKFLLEEIKKELYAPIIGQKTVYVSHGGKCVQLKVNQMGLLETEEPPEYQGDHEEADTLLAFHTYKIGGRVMVRSSDTDVLAILVGLVPKMPATSMITVDFGTGNKRRFINATNISYELEKQQAGLSEALIGFHALTGCDFTSAFYRKGKTIPFSYLEKDSNYVEALQTLGTDVVNNTAVTAYVCRLYGFKALNNINEARYQSFTKMTKGKRQEVQVKRINCSSLPPCEKVLGLHLLRANYIAMMWRQAHTQQPTNDLHPLNFGWVANDDGLYVPCWFEGETLPDTLASEDLGTEDEPDEAMDVALDAELELQSIRTETSTENVTGDTDTAEADDDSELDDQPWSDDSESECEDDDYG